MLLARLFSCHRYECCFPLVMLARPFSVPYCLRVFSPVAADRVMAARRPSAIMCFPWARRSSHDEEELGQSCGQAVIPQRGGKVYKECAVASLEILLHAIYYLSPQTYLSLPVNRRCDHPPQYEQRAYARRVRRPRRDHTGRDGYRETNEPTQGV